MKPWFLFLIFLGAMLASCENNEPAIPNGEKVALNNLLGAGEWDNSKIFPINDSLRMRMHQDEQNIYIAVDFDEVNLNQYRWVELYIYDSARHYRFHASGQLGEQYLRPPYWTENWNWGNNEMWTATTQRLAGEERKSSSNQAYEFQFEKKKFKSRHLRVLFHGYTINTQATFDASPFRYYYPADADRFKAESWMPIQY